MPLLRHGGPVSLLFLDLQRPGIHVQRLLYAGYRLFLSGDACDAHGLMLAGGFFSADQLSGPVVAERTVIVTELLRQEVLFAPDNPVEFIAQSSLLVPLGHEKSFLEKMNNEKHT